MQGSFLHTRCTAHTTASDKADAVAGYGWQVFYLVIPPLAPLNVQQGWYKFCIWKEFLWDINPNRAPLWIRGWAGKSLDCLLRDKKVHRNETSYSPLRFASWCATTYRSDLSILSGGEEEEKGEGLCWTKREVINCGRRKGQPVGWEMSWQCKHVCGPGRLHSSWLRPNLVETCWNSFAARHLGCWWGEGGQWAPLSGAQMVEELRGGGESKYWLLIRRGRADTGGIGTGQCRGQHWFAVHVSPLLINIYGQVVNQAGQTFLIMGIVISHFGTGSVGWPKWNPLLKNGRLGLMLRSCKTLSTA